MDDEEVAFRMEAWNESVTTSEHPVDVSHWTTEEHPQHEEIVNDEEVQEEVIAMEEMIQATHPNQHFMVSQYFIDTSTLMH